MEIFLTLAVSLAMIVLGVLLIHLLNSQHGDGMSSFHYGRSGMPVAGPASSVPRKIRGRAGRAAPTNAVIIATAGEDGCVPGAALARERRSPSLRQATQRWAHSLIS